MDKTVYDEPTVTQWLDNMVAGLESLVSGDMPTAIIGIRRGGVDVSQYLHKVLNSNGVVLNNDVGELNIAFYRDDFSTIGLHPVVGPSQVPFDVTGMHIILVDDVLGTGRTVRAAMNEIFDYGRPGRITLAVLVQRTDHELPVRADVVGQTVSVNANEYVDLDAKNWQVNVGIKA